MRISIYKVLTMISMVAVLGILTTGCGEKKAEEPNTTMAGSTNNCPPPTWDATRYVTSPNSGQPGKTMRGAPGSPDTAVVIDLSQYLVWFSTSVGAVTNGNLLNPNCIIKIDSAVHIGSLSRFPGEPVYGIADQPISVIISTGEIQSNKK